MQRSDETIMADYQDGDPEAIHKLFIRYKLRIFNFCQRILANRADAEEAASEVFVAIMRNKHSYDPQKKFSTWIFTIARNQSIDRVRKRKNVFNVWFATKGGVEDHAWDLPDTKENSREELVKRETQIQVKQAIANLPDEQKEALVLRQYHDFSYAEISEILNCSLEKVKILIFRAKEQLRVELISLKRGEQS